MEIVSALLAMRMFIVVAQNEFGNNDLLMKSILSHAERAHVSRLAGVRSCLCVDKVFEAHVTCLCARLIKCNNARLGLGCK